MNQTEEINVGDVVYLKKIKSPAMKVKIIDGDSAICFWFKKEDYKEKIFELKYLTKINPDSPIFHQSVLK